MIGLGHARSQAARVIQTSYRKRLGMLKSSHRIVRQVRLPTLFSRPKAAPHHPGFPDRHFPRFPPGYALYPSAQVADISVVQSYS